MPTMISDDDGPSCEPDPDATMAELLTDIGKQPIPQRLKDLAEQLTKALDDARKRQQRGH